MTKDTEDMTREELFAQLDRLILARRCLDEVHRLGTAVRSLNAVVEDVLASALTAVDALNESIDEEGILARLV